MVLDIFLNAVFLLLFPTDRPRRKVSTVDPNVFPVSVLSFDDSAPVDPETKALLLDTIEQHI